MKWFSINGILTEMKRIRWPKAKDLARDSVTVFGFVAFLALFFYLCQVVSSGFLQYFINSIRSLCVFLFFVVV